VITADTITDEQIRKVMRETTGNRSLAREIREMCRAALHTEGEHEAAASLRRRARSYVAGVIESRERCRAAEQARRSEHWESKLTEDK
jgi:hypothetical protein